jgi:hypothetical protein
VSLALEQVIYDGAARKLELCFNPTGIAALAQEHDEENDNE